jgi:hypothetical protein
MSLLLSCFCAWQLLSISNEVNNFCDNVSYITNNGNYILTNYWKQLCLFVICFVTLGSSTSNSSYGTSTMEYMSFDVLACHFLGDAPPPPFNKSFSCFDLNFFAHLFYVLYYNKALIVTLWRSWTYTPKHKHVHCKSKFFQKLFLHLR